MAATDARPVPRKNTAFRVTFPILDADGDLVAGAAGLDSEISKDGGTFADCTNEATQIATSSGVYYLDLTATEMNADTVAIIVKSSTSGSKTTTLVLYPEELGDYRIDDTLLATEASLTTIDNFLDTEIAAILAAVDTEVAAIKAKTDNLPASPAAAGDAMALTSGAVDAVLDEVVEGSTTFRQMLRGFAAVLLGKASGLASTTAIFRDVGDTKNRVTATVDSDDNRTAVTTDLT